MATDCKLLLDDFIRMNAYVISRFVDDDNVCKTCGKLMIDHERFDPKPKPKPEPAPLPHVSPEETLKNTLLSIQQDSSNSDDYSKFIDKLISGKEIYPSE